MKLFMAKILSIGFILFYGVEGRGADWKWYAETDSYECYYDAEDATPSSRNIVDVWTKLEFTKKGVSGIVKEFGKHYADISYSLELLEINCTDKKDRILSITQYSADGKILYEKSAQSRRPAWKTIPRESMDERLYNVVCK